MSYINISAKFLQKGSFGNIYYLYLNNNTEKLVLKNAYDNKNKNINKYNYSKKTIQNERDLNYLKHNNILVAEKYIFGDLLLNIIDSDYSIIVSNYLLFKYAKHGDMHDYVFKNQNNYNMEDFMYQISNALYYLETKCIVHCDVKVENILVFDENFYKLGDFGLSKKINNKYETFSGSSPCIHGLEVLMKHKAYLNTDVFSFGILLIDLLTKKKYNITKCNDFLNLLLGSNFPNYFLEKLTVCQKYKKLIKKCLVINYENRIYPKGLHKEVKKIVKNENNNFLCCFF